MTDRETLLEAALSASRDRVDGLTLPHPAWLDLSPEDRVAAFDATTAARRLEAALDARGLSTTGKAVLARLRAAGR